MPLNHSGLFLRGGVLPSRWADFDKPSNQAHRITCSSVGGALLNKRSKTRVATTYQKGRQRGKLCAKIVRLYLN